MRVALISLLALAIVGTMIVLFFAKSFRTRLAARFFKSKKRLWILPAVFLLSYSIIKALGGQLQLYQLLVLALYFSLPAFLIWSRIIRISEPKAMDAVFVLLVWLPQEFGLIDVKWTTIRGLPIPLGAPAMAIYLLILLTGLKSVALQCPGSIRTQSLRSVVVAYIVLFAVIVPLGMTVDFVAPGVNHRLIGNPGALLFLFLAIFFVVAVPEELLFRGWIQNLLLTRLKFLPGLLLAAVIFGLSHLDNKVVTSTHTFNIPNWLYAFFATFAGIAYGYVYQKQKSLFASTLLHALVDFTWVVAFAG
jgi:membrane protease YdiL (CAAX protease family)